VPSVPHSTPADARIDWYSFLRRPRLPSPTAESLQQFSAASILVTGAGGSIGSALSLQLARLRPRQLVLLDASEQALYRLQSTLSEASLISNSRTSHCRLILGNVTDRAHLEEIFQAHQPNFVFHAAAFKHVSLLEEFPLAAIVNNAIGTLTLTRCARNFAGPRLVLLSTDKAVAPISILGATKRVAELITLANHGVVLRLGNILGSEGSVSEIFLRQISAGAPVTITDPAAERYFLTCEEAIDLLLLSATAAQGGSLLVPRLEQQNSVSSLADFLISLGSPNAPPCVTFTGLRPGEKSSEALWSLDEQPLLKEKCGYLEITEPAPDHLHLYSELNRLEAAARLRDLPQALKIVMKLVPDYLPVRSMMELLPPSLHTAIKP
jgi:FlaA1/EpsC-like NDP-sugar epimerase